MADEETFDIVMRGYDRNQVDTTLEELKVENEHLSTYNESAVTEIASLKAEIELLKRTITQIWPIRLCSSWRSIRANPSSC